MIIMVSPILTCLLFLLNTLFAAGETGCPEAENIEPCTCTRLPTVRLMCEGLENDHHLRKVFAHSERYTFQQVYLANSVLLYIPSEIFEKVTVKELYIKNLTLQTIFSNLAVENHDLYKLQIENVAVLRSIIAQNFTRFVSLRELSIYNSSLSFLPKFFSESLPKNIKKIILHATTIRSISKGALSRVSNLDKLAVESGGLKKLSRDIFPRPFHGRILSFNDNKITTIPEDLFTDMPNLQFLSLMNNAISVIPETAFEGRSTNVPYIRLEGNPLQCDCQLLWMIRDKPEVIGGTCSSPEKFNGRKLQDLIPAEISCAE